MLYALARSLGQLADPRALRILAKILAVTLALLVLSGWAGWRAMGLALDRAGAGDLGQLLATGGALLLGWLLWRILALAVLQFFADEVVEAVEAKHYPTALANARKLPFREKLAHGLRGALRALGYNLLAPLARAPMATHLVHRKGVIAHAA